MVCQQSTYAAEVCRLESHNILVASRRGRSSAPSRHRANTLTSALLGLAKHMVFPRSRQEPSGTNHLGHWLCSALGTAAVQTPTHAVVWNNQLDVAHQPLGSMCPLIATWLSPIAPTRVEDLVGRGIANPGHPVSLALPLSAWGIDFRGSHLYNIKEHLRTPLAQLHGPGRARQTNSVTLRVTSPMSTRGSGSVWTEW